MLTVATRRAGWLATRSGVVSALLLTACAADTPTPSNNGKSSPVIVTGGANAPVLTAGVNAPTIPPPQVIAGSTGNIPPAPPIVSMPPVLPPATAGMAAPPPVPVAAGRAAPPVIGAAGTMAMMKPPPVIVSPNQKLPAVTSYDAPGPFPAREASASTGPNNAYTLIRPSNLDANGFKFIPATWGNGITTTPQFYPWLTTVASHGFVIIAANTSTVTPDDMTKGLDWLLMQNDMPGELQGKLDTSRAVCIGYSLGGGGAVTCGAHPKVIATVAMHPAAGFPTGLHGPLLLFSGTNDTVCVPETFVQPVFTGSPVPSFFAMLDGADHLEPVLGGRETAPFIAWLRLWVFGDEGAKPFFYGPDCKLCKAPWTKPQSKMLN